MRVRMYVCNKLHLLVSLFMCAPSFNLKQQVLLDRLNEKACVYQVPVILSLCGLTGSLLQCHHAHLCIHTYTHKHTRLSRLCSCVQYINGTVRAFSSTVNHLSCAVFACIFAVCVHL